METDLIEKTKELNRKIRQERKAGKFMPEEKVINISLKDIDNLYEDYSNAGEKEVKEAVINYIYKNARDNSRGKDKFALKIVLMNEITGVEKKTAEEKIREYAYKDYRNHKKKHTKYLISGFIFVALAFLSIGLAVLFNMALNTENNILEIIMSVMVWFLLWEGLGMLLFSRPPCKAKYLLSLMLYYMPIEITAYRGKAD